MTLSEKDRVANIELSFRLLMAELGDRSISRTFFDPHLPPFDGVLQTTWKELCDQGWIEEWELYGQPHYRLTGRGWIEGLWQTGASKDRSLLERLGNLAAALKGYVKGRQRDVIVEFGRLIGDVKLPEGWVFNAIESGVFEKLQRRHGAPWQERGILIRIPLNFGIELLDHTADLRAQLEAMEEQLETATKELLEYKCSFCGAPIDAQGPVPLSEDVDGYFVSYACGRYEVDGDEQPCPSDPRFPKLDDYELEFKEHPDEPSLKWFCWARPKTPIARRVRLQSGQGRTKEEARQQVVDSYTRIAKPWPRR
ncbi:MAG: hypothetical protein L0338_39020 [Acidobacteria bacterium]|nr:hypothetical protein [Acidobacteriota bacterium]